ncbi:ATP-binding protein [Catenisphaera adipataccumulans]|jgi:predicted AAA+ superfamily ATPase|uniref:AAA domain-containing protein n=1 Tax=Catenisphaera adipataccumulans TaxID=700500 RepID=A0A7W8FUU1_9FIRM|nr:AAA family ATPase [Catenisphaera adipataccumulans]MBB5182453.1 hypothetical protein [Catenisphaera adipataccumulans]
MQSLELKKRDLYLNRLIDQQDNGKLKIITGLRGVGKSSLLFLMEKHLRARGKSVDQIVYINFQPLQRILKTPEKLKEKLSELAPKEGHYYMFLDEIQIMNGWQDVVNEWMKTQDVDMYICGSNRSILSEELDAIKEDNYAQIVMLPLSLPEFIEFNGFMKVEVTQSLLDKQQHPMYRSSINDRIYTLEEVYDLYIKYGGLPILFYVGLEMDRARIAVDGAYCSIVYHDILEVQKSSGQRLITDPILLREIIAVLTEDIGQVVSYTSVGKQLIREGFLNAGKRKSAPAPRTIEAYILALCDAFFFYQVPRYDMKNETFLQTLDKYFLIDVCFRNYLFGMSNDVNRQTVLINKIYFEFIRRQYDVCVGKNGMQNIHFIAKKNNETLYVMVEDEINERNIQKKTAVLRRLDRDDRKVIIAWKCKPQMTKSGIQIVNAMDFLMEQAL